MLSGTYNYQLDAKARMRIPAKLRSELVGNIYVSKGTSGCLFILSEEYFEKLVEKFKSVPLTDKDGQKALRAFMAGVEQVTEDSQGRVLLSKSQREFAKLEKNIVFIGAMDRVEIWSEEVWNDYNASDTPQEFDQTLDILNKYGV